MSSSSDILIENHLRHARYISDILDRRMVCFGNLSILTVLNAILIVRDLDVVHVNNEIGEACLHTAGRGSENPKEVCGFIFFPFCSEIWSFLMM